MTNRAKPYYETDRRGAIFNFVLSEMVRGALWGALVVFGIGALMYAIYLLGLLLPEDSKNMPDPRLSGAIVAPLVAGA